MQKWCALEKGPWTYACVKSCFLSSFQYTRSVVCWLSWPHDTLPCVLIYRIMYVFPSMQATVQWRRATSSTGRTSKLVNRASAWRLISPPIGGKVYITHSTHHNQPHTISLATCYALVALVVLHSILLSILFFNATVGGSFACTHTIHYPFGNVGKC